MASPGTPEEPFKRARRLLGKALLLTTLIFAALQCRHPYFTMTDDNLAAGYPFFTEVGRHLLGGENPSCSDSIFGGHYDLARDAQYFSWHPFYLLTSLLADTPFHLWIMDVDALFLYLLATAGFVSLASRLREEGLIEVTDEWILFCALSFTFTMIALVTCASWLTFENNIGALPWLALGILQTKWRRGVGLITLFSVHQILGGHPEPLVTNSIFLSFFALGISVWRRSSQPLGIWLAGYALALVLVLPLLIPVAEGFWNSTRSTGTYLAEMQQNRIPANLFPSALFFGTAFALIASPPTGTINGVFVFSLAGCAAAWCLIPALTSRTKWRFLETLSLTLAAAAVVLICRPIFISEFLLHIPLLKSMRWPFRELVQFQFFFHLFLLLRPVTCAPLRRFLAALIGSVLFVLPMLLYQVAPTFNDMSLDRKIILSGRLEPYWAQIRTLLKPEDRYVVLLPAFPAQTDSMRVPYSFMGGYNYAMLVRVVCGSGYSQTVPVGSTYLKTPIFSPWGAFKITQREALERERPDLKFITLEQVSPLKITLSSRDGPTIDLTSYMPADIIYPEK